MSKLATPKEDSNVSRATKFSLTNEPKSQDTLDIIDDDPLAASLDDKNFVSETGILVMNTMSVGKKTHYFFNLLK